MDSQILLLASCLLIISLFAITAVSYSIVLFRRHRQDIKSTKPVWKNNYPSLEELHALFDRGDIMLATVFIASSLQLSHPELGKVLQAHSTYKTNPWRRIIRTMAFIYIMIRSNSSERQKVIAWLQKLHRPIPLFVFETNVLVFATFAYGLVKTHQLLGNITPGQEDGIIRGTMSMADKLDPKDIGREVPTTMAQVEAYLQKQLSLNPKEMLLFNRGYSELYNVRNLIKRVGVRNSFGIISTLMRLGMLKLFAETISNTVLGQKDGGQSVLGQLFWWHVRKVHCFLSHFHYSMCPRVLTFDGALNTFVTANPGMANVLTELYDEIFGDEKRVQPVDVSHLDLRRFSDLEAHLPRMDMDGRSIPTVPGFRKELVELIKCSYYRGIFAHNAPLLPQHLGVIMDGNRRYSRHKGLFSVLAGHQVGAHKLLQVISWSFGSGVQNLTVWALSDDNLKRGPQELNPLFSMMSEYIREMMVGDAPFSIPDVRFRVVGDRSILPDYLNDMIVEAEAATAQNTKFNLQIAIGYGGRSEITRATKLAVKAKMEQDGVSVEEAIETMTPAEISRQTYSAQLGLPHIDAILRTSGENRLSGFALWESHHAEFAIVKENWPALTQSRFLQSLLDLSKRNRRLGA